MRIISASIWRPPDDCAHHTEPCYCRDWNSLLYIDVAVRERHMIKVMGNQRAHDRRTMGIALLNTKAIDCFVYTNGRHCELVYVPHTQSHTVNTVHFRRRSRYRILATMSKDTRVNEVTNTKLRLGIRVELLATSFSNKKQQADR